MDLRGDRDPDPQRAAELERLVMTTPDLERLAHMNEAEIRAFARELGIPHVEQLNRPALVEAIHKHVR